MEKVVRKDSVVDTVADFVVNTVADFVVNTVADFVVNTAADFVVDTAADFVVDMPDGAHRMDLEGDMPAVVDDADMGIHKQVTAVGMVKRHIQWTGAACMHLTYARSVVEVLQSLPSVLAVE